MSAPLVVTIVERGHFRRRVSGHGLVATSGHDWTESVSRRQSAVVEAYLRPVGLVVCPA